jgi:hypothetical protein
MTTHVVLKHSDATSGNKPVRVVVTYSEARQPFEAELLVGGVVIVPIKSESQLTLTEIDDA